MHVFILRDINIPWHIQQDASLWLDNFQMLLEKMWMNVQQGVGEWLRAFTALLGLQFSSQHLRRRAYNHLHAIPAPRDPRLSSGLHRHLHTSTNTHIHKYKNKKKTLKSIKEQNFQLVATCQQKFLKWCIPVCVVSPGTMSPTGF